jgi:hypothetical protein
LGVWALPIARLVWGLSFAVLNIATQALPTAEPSDAARRSGRARSIVAVGPMLGGAILAQTVGPRSAFVVLAIAALAGLFFARRLPSERDGGAVRIPGAPHFALPSRLDLWSFTQGLTLDGLFVVGLSVLAAAAVPDHAALAAGAALALRYAAEIALSPLAGVVAERRGAEHLLVWLSLAAAGSLALVGTNLIWPRAVLVVVLRGLLQPLPAPVAAALNPGPARVPVLAKLVTWRDLGAGVGPLLAGLLLPLLAPSLLYGGAALLMAISAASLTSRNRIERM